MTKIKGPVQSPPSETAIPTNEAKAASVKPNIQEPLTDGFQKAAQGLLGYKSSPLMSGAYKIFSDAVVLPANLLNTADPENNAKYLRLLAAVWGMDEVEKYFQTLTEEQEKKRKIERDERQRKKKEQADSNEDEEENKKEK